MLKREPQHDAMVHMSQKRDCKRFFECEIWFRLNMREFLSRMTQVAGSYSPEVLLQTTSTGFKET